MDETALPPSPVCPQTVVGIKIALSGSDMPARNRLGFVRLRHRQFCDSAMI